MVKNNMAPENNDANIGKIGTLQVSKSHNKSMLGN